MATATDREQRQAVERTSVAMPQVLLEGYTIEEILALPGEQLQSIVLRDEPVVFKAGSASLLGRFKVEEDTLVMELAHVDGGGEGALPTLAALAGRYAARQGLRHVEWRVNRTGFRGGQLA
jgi:hypothetical protein